MNRRATLKFTTGPLAGKTFSLGPGEYIFLGSGEQCAVRISDDPLIEQNHAAVFYEPSGKILIKDMGTKSGTSVNGKRLTKAMQLSAGDRVTIGQFCTFQSSWWNALQTTQLTRFSAIHGAKPVTTSSQHKDKKQKIIFTSLAVGILLGISWYGSGQYIDKKGEVVFVDETSNEQASKDRARKSAPTSFTGSLSAKLFKEKSKKPARNKIEITPQRQFIWDEIVLISRRFGNPPPTAMDPGFILEVERQLERYTRHNHHMVLLKRKAEFTEMIEKTLLSKGLPIELGYIVWVESNYKVEAESPVGAAGLWQFMPETAREYGLRVGRGIDDRRDPQKSTVAAADYFTSLIRMFGSERYLLAIASYNTGQNRVKRFQIASTIHKEHSSDFWNIRLSLPKETYEYVPRVIAAIIIGRNPGRYNPATH
jgi:hypothetical protein